MHGMNIEVIFKEVISFRLYFEMKTLCTLSTRFMYLLRSKNSRHLRRLEL